MEERLPELTLIGHASVKVKTKEGIVIYVDPYWEGDYSEKADIVLITHGHQDHNDLSKINKKNTTKVITWSEIHPVSDQYEVIEEAGVKVTGVPAYNKNHKKEICVGYLIEFDGIKLYHAGDTSKIPEMNELKKYHITYALYPTDGVYNMGPKEASEAAEMVGAKVNIPIHHFDVTKEQLQQLFIPEGKRYLEYGSTIQLEP